MSEGDVHKRLKKVGMWWIKSKVTDLVSMEVKYKNIRSIADVAGINLKRKEIRIVEVKATKADYVRDTKLMDIDKSYYKHCNYFYIMCPVDIIQLDDVPKEYGLLWVDDNNEVIIKRSPKKYTGRLKTMFDTSLKNIIRSLTNQMLYHYILPELGIITEYKKKNSRRKSK